MQKLAVVYFPNIPLEKIDTFRRKYDPHSHIISPHITIVSPLLGISESQLIEHVEGVIKDLKPFSLHLAGLTKTFDDCLFLLVQEGNEKVITLHEILYSGILDPYVLTDFPFVPHITLGYFRTGEDVFDEKLYTEAYKEAQDLQLDISCEFGAVSVIKGDGLSSAEIVKTIKL